MINIAMIDLETLGTEADAVVVSAGVCVFRADTDHLEVVHNIRAKFNLAEQLQRRIINQKTLGWWMQQPDEARKVFYAEASGSSVASFWSSLDDALRAFKVDEVWSMGADFDIAILQHLFTQFNYPIPWSYKATRCFRTMKQLFKNIPAPERTTTRHDAYEDAFFQAEWLHKILQSVQYKASQTEGDEE